MYGYKVNLKGIPEILFACSTTVDDYIWKNHHNENTIEISISKSEAYTMTINGETLSLQNKPRLTCIVGNEKIEASSKSGVKHEILTTAVQFEHVQASGCELCEDDAIDNSYFIMPAILTDSFSIQEVTRLLNKYINSYTSGTASDKAICISMWFEILSIIDRCTRETLYKKKGSSDNYYIKKLNYIIENKYNERLSLTDIAKEFGVSMSYLSHIYSSKSKITFKDALLSARMKKAKELITASNCTIDEITDMVGICDEAYLRKCFKKFYGVSISEFKKINKGLTLYHDKPVRK